MKTSLFLFLFFSSLLVCGQVLEITPINEKLYVYTTYQKYKDNLASANAMYLVTTKGVILFDTPWDQAQNQPLLDSIKNKHNLQVICVFATHAHEDRAGGFDFFNKKGIPTYASEHTNDILRLEGKPVALNTFKHGKKFLIGNEKFDLEYFGAGHTKDNLVIWFPEYGVLHGGCLVKSAEAVNLGFVGEADLKAWPQTILAIKDKYKQINLVVSGHDDWKTPGALDRTLILLKNKN